MDDHRLLPHRGLTTAVGIFTVKPVYRATATIQIDKENPQIVDFREIFAVSAWDIDYYQTHHQILASRQLAKRIVNTLNLSEHPEFIPEPKCLPKIEIKFFRTPLQFEIEHPGLALWPDGFLP